MPHPIKDKKAMTTIKVVLNNGAVNTLIIPTADFLHFITLASNHSYEKLDEYQKVTVDFDNDDMPSIKLRNAWDNYQCVKRNREMLDKISDVAKNQSGFLKENVTKAEPVLIDLPYDDNPFE